MKIVTRLIAPTINHVFFLSSTSAPAPASAITSTSVPASSSVPVFTSDPAPVPAPTPASAIASALARKTGGRSYTHGFMLSSCIYVKALLL